MSVIARFPWPLNVVDYDSDRLFRLPRNVVRVYSDNGHYFAVDENDRVICRDSDTACIQEAISTAFQRGLNKVVIFPGVYNVYKTINLPNLNYQYEEFSIEGFGMMKTTVVLNSGQNPLLSIPPGPSNYNWGSFSIKNISFRVPYDYTSSLLDLRYANNLYMKNVSVSASVSYNNSGSIGVNIGKRGGNGRLLENVIAYAFETNFYIYDNHVVMLRCSSQYSKKYGIFIDAGVADVAIINPHIQGAPTINDGVGIFINLPNGGQVVVENPYFERSSLGTNQYDIFISAPTSAAISSVVVINPVSATGAPKIYISGEGYVLGRYGKQFGTATISAGQTSVTVNHGLGTTPRKVIVTPTSNPGTQWWVSNVTATSFTINVASAPTTNLTFYWEAEV